MTHTEAVEYLHSLGNEVLTAKLGLRNITVLLSFLGDPHKKFKSVLIAGTNGKGSVAAFCESILRVSGYRTGLYTSPHLIQIEERIRVNGVMIPAEDFARLTEEVRNSIAILTDGLHSSGSNLRLDCHPTYFEIVTAVGLKYFAEQQIDVALLEVGLGGRFDATNVVDPLVAVITNVDYDHQKYLGNRLEEIATEKAGIIKPHSYERTGTATFLADPGGASNNVLPVIFCNGTDSVVEVIQGQCKATGSRLIRALEGIEYKVKANPLGYFRLLLNSAFGCGTEIDIPLPGEHQVLNALTAIRTMEILRGSGFRISCQNICEGVVRTRWPGRLEILDHQPRLILDGAHNPAGAEMARAYVRQFLQSGEIVMVYGTMRDKAIREMAQKLFPLARQIILTRASSDRAAEPEEIADLVPEFHRLFRFTKNVGEALSLAQELASKEGTILVVGSLFLVGDAKKILQQSLVA
jgi:dihydrofolate synthase / folylpolyglutamate synthase